MKRYFHLLVKGGYTVLCTGILITAFALDLQKTPTGYTGVVNLSNVSIEDAGNGYVAVQIPGFYYNNPVGMAGLPETVFRLAIGKQKLKPTVNATVLEVEHKVLSAKIHPMQEDFPITIPLSKRPLSLDRGYYTSRGLHEQLVTVSDPFVCFGVPGVEVILRPVSYNPLKNTVTIVKKFKLDITMPEGISAIPATYSEDGHAYIKKLFVNYDVPLPRGLGKDGYLILHESRYAENEDLKTFIEFREDLYDVTAVDIDDAGSDESEVKSYINDLSPKPTYILFVGNAGTMPHYTASVGSRPHTYWPYSLEEGSEKYSDCFVGMFSVRSAEELGNIVHKTMHTEKNIDDYPKRVTLYSTYDGDGHIHDQVTYIKDHYWEPGGFEIDWQIADGDPMNASQATAAAKKAIADNASRYVCYQGHGGTTGFSEGISSSDVTKMTNDEVYPFVWGFACLTGTFTGSKCFGDAWISAEGGACMYTGASVSSASYQKILNAGMARMAAVEPDLHTIGQIFFFGKHFVFDTSISASGFSCSETAKKEGASMYNLFGDPALETISYATNTSEDDKIVFAGSMQVKSFTPSIITLNLPSAGKYNLDAYTADGKKIRTIAADKYLAAGERVLPWNGSNFSKGVYFIHLSKEKEKVVNKFILLQ